MLYRIFGAMLKLPVMLVFGLLIASCVQTTASVVTSEIKGIVCDLWQPISWHVDDTDQTIVGVKVNNARRQAFCR